MTALISTRESRDTHGVSVDILESTYIRYFEKLGITPLPLSNFHQNPERLFSELSVKLLVLTGGGSIPSKYYDTPHQDFLQKQRDITEAICIRKALAQGIPILGICRGMQHLNALFGGHTSILTHLHALRPIGADHPVLLGRKRTLRVNNFHNHGIFTHNMAPGFSLIALDQENNVVEGFAWGEKKILGLQWHPERAFEDPESLLETTLLIEHFLKNGGIIDESYYIGCRPGDTT